MYSYVGAVAGISIPKAAAPIFSLFYENNA